jgi:hypothetical protein
MSKRIELAWLFESDLKWLTEMKKRLDPISSPPWVKIDSDSKADYLSHVVNEHALIRIYDYGKAFVATVSVDAGARDAQALVETSKQRLLTELLPALGARAVHETTPPE